jgi:hypothetical protein
MAFHASSKNQSKQTKALFSNSSRKCPEVFSRQNFFSRQNSLGCKFLSAIKKWFLLQHYFFICVKSCIPWLVPGLPDFSWRMLPKPDKNVPNEHKLYEMVIKYPEIFQMSINYTDIFQSKAHQNLPKLGFLVLKQTIWQPWLVQRFGAPGSKTLPRKVLLNQSRLIWLSSPAFSQKDKNEASGPNPTIVSYNTSVTSQQASHCIFPTK